MSGRVFPTGVVRYQPEKCWNGLTLIPAVQGVSSSRGAALFDMNGNLVHTWEGLFGAFDNKLLPGGDILGTSGYMKGYWLDCLDLEQRNWAGDRLWRFNRGEVVRDLETGAEVMSARQHHDFQREGSPCGYYAPGLDPKKQGVMLVNSTATRGRQPIDENRCRRQLSVGMEPF